MINIPIFITRKIHDFPNLLPMNNTKGEKFAFNLDNNWIYKFHRNGNWVTYREATQIEIEEAKKVNKACNM